MRYLAGHMVGLIAVAASVVHILLRKSWMLEPIAAGVVLGVVEVEVVSDSIRWRLLRLSLVVSVVDIVT